MSKFFAKFKENGERVTSWAEGVNFKITPGYDLYGTDDKGGQVVVGWEPEKIEPPIPDGFIEITKEEWNLYAANRYIRGTDGKPIEKVATAEETFAVTKLMKLAEIKSKLNATDYKCLKFIDGDFTVEEYEETKALRQALRKAYSAIEAAATIDEVNAVEY